MEAPKYTKSRETTDAFIVRLMLDLQYVKHGKDIDAFREATQRMGFTQTWIDAYVPIEPGWRNNLLIRFLKSALPKVNIDQTQPCNVVGHLMGIMDEASENIAVTIKEFEGEPFSQGQSVINHIGALFQDDGMKYSQVADKLPPEKRKELLDGYSSSYRSVTRDAEHLRRESRTSTIYAILLQYEEEINKLPTVEAIYDFVMEILGPSFYYELDSFRKLCARIKLRGNKYNDYKKSIKTPKKKLT